MKQKLTLILLLVLFSFSINAQTTIDFETDGAGYTPSAVEGNSNIDVFNRVNVGVGTNTSYYWAAEDLTLVDPFIILDAIDVTGETAFSFSVDFLTPNTNDWDATDELLITYSLDGGASQNLMWVQNLPDDSEFNSPAALDLDFDGIGDVGQELPAIVDDWPASVGNDFATFSANNISLSGNTSLVITLQYKGLTSAAEGIYMDNIVVNLGVVVIPPSISNITTNPINPTSADDVVVSATITDDVAVTGANLYWSLTSPVTTSDNPTVMGNLVDVYSAIIGAQTDGTTVYYMIDATDGTTTTTSSEMSYTVTDPVAVPPLPSLMV